MLTRLRVPHKCQDIIVTFRTRRTFLSGLSRVDRATYHFGDGLETINGMAINLAGIHKGAPDLCRSTLRLLGLSIFSSNSKQEGFRSICQTIGMASVLQ